MLDVPEHRVRSWVRAGFLHPRRGPRGAFRFNFQDLVILRAARGLAEAGIPPQRLRNALSALRDQLPRGRSLAAVAIRAEGGQVVVRDGSEEWEPETGQRPLPYRDYERFESFQVADLAERAAPLARRAAEAASRRDDLTAEDWYELGYELEATAAGEAQDAYRRALALDPTHADAHLNLGRLLHEEGNVPAAADHYRQAAAQRPGDATAHFNLGVALQDLDRPAEARAAYELTLGLDPAYADAYFNLAALADRQGDRLAALRHLKSYRSLTRRR